jgi:hypothetical protein
MVEAEKEEHIFLRHNEAQNGLNKQFALYSQIQSTDLLYNSKTYFRIENELIQIGETNLKEKIANNIKTQR